MYEHVSSKKEPESVSRQSKSIESVLEIDDSILILLDDIY